MAQMDPYSGDMQTPTLGETLGGLLNPIELAKLKYTTSPSAWGGSLLGISKGVWMPVDVSQLKDFNLGKYSRSVGRSFKKGGAFSAVKTAGKPFKSVFNTNNYIGGGYLRDARGVKSFIGDLDNTLFDQFAGMRRGDGANLKFLKKRRYSPERANELSKTIRQEVINWIDQSGNINKLNAASLRENLMSRVSNREFVARYGNIQNKIDDIMSTVGVSKQGAKGVQRTAALRSNIRKAGISKAIGKIGSGRYAFAGAARAGIFAMKGFAAVGLVSMMWDITQAISEPIGRAIVSKANSTMEDYKNRFMPEMGGRLAMSYMTSGAATERQRAVQAISKAYINGRSAFGQEAMYAHG